MSPAGRVAMSACPYTYPHLRPDRALPIVVGGIFIPKRPPWFGVALEISLTSENDGFNYHKNRPAELDLTIFRVDPTAPRCGTDSASVLSTDAAQHRPAS